MSKSAKFTGALVATAVAGLFMAGNVHADDTAATKPVAAAKVKCEGVNACKGKGQCGGANHGCAGKNACKGKGWVYMDEAACKEKGGSKKS